MVALLLALVAMSDLASAQLGPCHAAIPVVDHMEITQGIQFDPCNTAPSCNGTPAPNEGLLPLIDHRATTARIYVKSEPQGCELTGDDARLYIWDTATSAGYFSFIWNSDNGPIDIGTSVPEWDREDDDATINFTFFPHRTPPGHQLRFLTCVSVVGPNGAAIDVTCSELPYEETRSFVPGKAPAIVGVPVRETRVAPNLPDPTLTTAGIGDAMHWAVFPFPEAAAGEAGDDGYWMTEGEYINYQLSEMFLALAKWRATKALDPRTIIFGWLPGTLHRLNGQADDKTMTIAIGNADSRHSRFQWIFAHELGHLFGLNHVDGATGEVGWDVLNRLDQETRSKPAALLDLMDPPSISQGEHQSPGGREPPGTWIMPAHYAMVHARINLATPTATPTAGPYRLVAGSLPDDPNGVWSLQPSFEFTGPHEPLEPGTTGSGEVRLLDSQDTVLYSSRFEPSTWPDTDESSFVMAVPVITDTDRIVLYIDDEPRDVITRTTHAPQVSIVSPTSSSTLDEETVIEWQASDDDDDPLSAIISYSPDQGATWYVLAVRPAGTQLTLLPERLPSSSNAWVRVQVNDGFHTTEATVTDLLLTPNRSPEAHIFSPRDGAVYRQGAMVILLGRAKDPEDGWLDTDLVWYSNVDGWLGTGFALNLAHLSAGEHVITLEATDSGQASGTDSVNITVQ